MAGFEKERDRLDTMMANRNGTARVSDATTPFQMQQVSNR